jgi:hypothetical protein
MIEPDYGDDSEKWTRLERPLDETKRDALVRLCAEFGFTDDLTGDIEFVARVLREFELHGKASLKTPVERSNGLAEVERLALALRRALGELERPDLDEIGWRMPDDGLRAMVYVEKRTESAAAVIGFDINEAFFRSAQLLPTGGELTFRTVYPLWLGRAGHIGAEAEKLAHVAGLLRSSIGDKGRGGGRKNTLKHYAWHVEEIARCVEANPVQRPVRIGRGGEFERLCEVVWNAANVPSKPAGAIREMIRLRKMRQDYPDDLPL